MPPGLRRSSSTTTSFSSFPHRTALTIGSQQYVARRVHDGWLVVAGMRSDERSDLEVLHALIAGPLRLQAPIGVPPTQRAAQCTIGLRRLPGLKEVSQTSFLARANAGVKGVPLPPNPHPELSDCSIAGFYMHAWPLNVTVMLPSGPRGVPPQLRHRRPVPHHPDEFTIIPIEGNARPAMIEHRGAAWIEVAGGSGVRQQQRLLHRLVVNVAHSRWVVRSHGNTLEDVMLAVP